MGTISRGFFGRRTVADVKLPPGQYLTTDFPVLSAGPTPRTPLKDWSFTIRGAVAAPQSWTWVLRDFKASILTSLQSARHFTINAAPPQGDLNGDGFTFNDRMANLPRNSYLGDPYYDVDLRIQRQIPFTERIKGEASVEFFNLLNRVNVQEINHLYVTPSPVGDFAGPVPQKFGDHITDVTGTFGSPKFVAPARQIQLSFRINF